MSETILVVNAGSSSIKFQLFEIGRDDRLERRLKGQIEGIGTRPRLIATGTNREVLTDETWPAAEVGTCARRARQACRLPAARHWRQTSGRGWATVSSTAARDTASQSPLIPPCWTSSNGLVRSLRCINRITLRPFGQFWSGSRIFCRLPASTPPFTVIIRTSPIGLPFLKTLHD